MFIPGMPQTKVCLAAIGHLSSSFVQPGMLSVVWQSRRPAIQWIVLWWLFARSVVSHNSALFCVGEWILVFRWKKRHFEPCDIWQSLLCPYQFEVSDLWRLCQDSLLSFALPLPFLLIHIYIYIIYILKTLGWLFLGHQRNYIFPHDLCLLGECRVVCIWCESAELQEHSYLQQDWLKGFLATKKSEVVMTDGDAPL